MSKIRKVRENGKFGLNLFLDLYALKDFRGNPKVFCVSIDEIDIDNTFNYRYCFLYIDFFCNSNSSKLGIYVYLVMRNL